MQKTVLPFVFKEQSILKTPIMVTVPHCGRYYPPELLSATNLDSKQIRGAEDFYVDELSKDAPNLGIDFLYANIARAFIDLNRSETSLDDKLIDGLNNHKMDEMARGGQGIIPRILPGNLRIMNQKIPLSEALQRIEKYFRPYHDRIRRNLARISSKFGTYLLIDMHSMPNSALGNDSADIIIGDNFSRSCDKDLSAAALAYFREKGFKTRANRPYAGGYTTQNYSDLFDKRNVIQIEINRSLYMDEETLEKTEEFEHITTLVGRFFELMINEMTEKTYESTKWQNF